MKIFRNFESMRIENKEEIDVFLKDFNDMLKTRFLSKIKKFDPHALQRFLNKALAIHNEKLLFVAKIGNQKLFTKTFETSSKRR